jgi:hypothetical protein
MATKHDSEAAVKTAEPTFVARDLWMRVAPTWAPPSSAGALRLASALGVKRPASLRLAIQKSG